MSAGILMITCIAFYELLGRSIPRRALWSVLLLALILLGLIAFSLSNKIALGTHVYQVNGLWGSVGKMFRSSSRMCWPAYYGSWLAVMYLATRNLRPWRADACVDRRTNCSGCRSFTHRPDSQKALRHAPCLAIAAQ